MSDNSSRWQDIYDHLKKAGFDVYSPGQHRGECVSPYVVVKDQGGTRLGNFTSMKHLYDILCYVPKDKFSTLEVFVLSVKKSMMGLYPMIRPAHYETPSFYDDTNKSHMISVQYLNYRKFDT